MAEVNANPTVKRLYRSCHNRILAGVGGGIAEYLNIDPTIARLILILIIIPGGVGVLFYVLAWFLIPLNPNCSNS